MNAKFQFDGTKLAKIQAYTPVGIERGFFVNDQRVGDIDERFNLQLEGQDWLSLKPTQTQYHERKPWVTFDSFGEFDNNKLSGRGIKIWHDGHILIGNFFNNGQVPGDYISIDHNGSFKVGKRSWTKEIGDRDFGVAYLTDGTRKEYGWPK